MGGLPKITNYTGGWLVLDEKDPSKIVQKSKTHLFVSTMDYEIGNGDYPVQRYRTIFTTHIILMGGDARTQDGQLSRVWYGAADASVATAIVRVKASKLIQ